MDTMQFSLAFSLTIVGFLTLAEGNAVIKGGSDGHGHRSVHRRSTFFDNLPGSTGQTIPPEAVSFTFLRQSCHSKELVQNVTVDGCEPQSIRNRMCYGVCASIHMPGVPGNERMELCTKCQPAGQRRSTSVTLKCAGGIKRVITLAIFDRCACSPCNSSAG